MVKDSYADVVRKERKIVARNRNINAKQHVLGEARKIIGLSPVTE